MQEYLWVGHDTTEEHRLQGQIVHQEKMAAVGLLAAGVAHEIGNPLASISSVAQTAHRKSDDPYVRGKLELVRTHIDRIATIVRRMVDFARPPRYEWRACSVNDLVRNATQFLEYDKRADKVSLELDLDEGLLARAETGALLHRIPNDDVRDESRLVIARIALGLDLAEMDLDAGTDAAAWHEAVLPFEVPASGVIFECRVDRMPGGVVEVDRFVLKAD